MMTTTSIAAQAQLGRAAPLYVPRATGSNLDPILRVAWAHTLWDDIRVLEAHARKRTSARHQPRSLAAWIEDRVTRAFHALARERRIRREARELMTMSDHMLKDIGINRAEIGQAARYGRD